MSLKNIVFCRKITFIRIKEMRRCLLREFWNDIIIPNFISKKKKQNKNYGRHYVYDYAKFL